MLSQQSRSHILTRFQAVNALDRDEVYLSVRWLLDVPRLARPSHPSSKPCSRRLPAAGAFFVFLAFFSKRLFVGIETYPENLSYKNLSRWIARLLYPWRVVRGSNPGWWCFFLFSFCCHFLSCGLFQSKIVYDDWGVVWAIQKSVLYVCIHSAAATAAASLLCVEITVVAVSLFVAYTPCRHRLCAVSQQSTWTWYIIKFVLFVRCCTTYEYVSVYTCLLLCSVLLCCCCCSSCCLRLLFVIVCRMTKIVAVVHCIWFQCVLSLHSIRFFSM